MAKKNDQVSRRELIRQRQQVQQTRSRLILFAFIAIIILFAAVFIWNLAQPAAGVAVEIMENATDHVEDGTLVEYNTNPPTSGPHYAQPLYAGFFDENSQETLIPNVVGHIVHNLEHGYVVVWFNCSQLDDAACSALKDQIRSVIAEVGEAKVIVFPWNTMDELVVLTSWGQEMRMMDAFDARDASRFIKVNRSSLRAPEPNAQ